ncbi:pIIIa [Polar bear adenovirus 1]|uniref:PIIIa n=1 Tax=Polar bear adenovirus 1 TaxID=2250215 RepID=A0A345S500_9ADEN|nr:pIIIa [Polar bear adenovirus 1]AXI68653.1 pIIIa [Polar bear adenovirus 1]
MENQWDSTLNRVMGLNSAHFRSLPKSQRFELILEAVVPSRKNPTYDKIMTIVEALIRVKAIRKDEGAQLYNALIQRVSRYNSNNVQSNLDHLVRDVRNVLAEKSRLEAQGLSSLVTFNAFLNSIPATVERGQENYMGFINALKAMVMEVPQSEVYQSGPHFFFQTSRHGSQIVNLNAAFENLRHLWGVQNPSGEGVAASSLLTPNTRLLLLMVAPFTDVLTVSKTTYIGHLLTLYRETIGSRHIDEETYNEITSVSRDLGHRHRDDLHATLNFLLTNRKRTLPVPISFSDEEIRVIRYLQESVKSFLSTEGNDVSIALDKTAASLDPSFYATHRDFINKLMDYFHRAAALSPRYFRHMILNPHWVPPPSFNTGNYTFPEDDYFWDEYDNGDSVSADFEGEPPERNEEASNTLDDESVRLARQAVTRSKERNVSYNGVDELIDRTKNWKTYRQTFQEQQHLLSGQGRGNPFSYLMPQGSRFL